MCLPCLFVIVASSGPATLDLPQIAKANSFATTIAAILDRDQGEWGTYRPRGGKKLFFAGTIARNAATFLDPCPHAPLAANGVAVDATVIARAQCAPTPAELLCSVLAHTATKRVPNGVKPSASMDKFGQTAAAASATTAGWRLAAAFARAASDARLPCGRANRIDGRGSEWWSAASIASSLALARVGAGTNASGAQAAVQSVAVEAAAAASPVAAATAPAPAAPAAEREAQFEFAAAMLASAARLHYTAVLRARTNPKPGADRAALEARARAAAGAGWRSFRSLLEADERRGDRDGVHGGNGNGGAADGYTAGSVRGAAGGADSLVGPTRRVLHETELSTDHGGDPRRWVRARVARGHRADTPVRGELDCLLPAARNESDGHSGYHEGTGGLGKRVFNQALLMLGLQPGRHCPQRRCRVNMTEPGAAPRLAPPRCSRVIMDGVLGRSAAAQLRQHARRTMKWPAARVDRRDMEEQRRNPGKHHRDAKEGGARCCAKKENMNLLHSALIGAFQGGDVRAHLQLLRWVEWQRRAVAREYGVALGSLHLASTFVTRVTATMTAKSYSNIHADQSSFDRFHFSNTLYLGTLGADFRGGTLTFFGDNAEYMLPTGQPMRMASLSVEPRVGRAVLTSSGWENIHQLDRVLAGSRFSMQTFFTTTPPEPNNTTVAAAPAAPPSFRAIDFVTMCARPANVPSFEQCQQLWARWFS
eukprot:g6283.t1